MSTFERARRQGAYRSLARAVTRHGGPPELLPLDEATKKLRPFERRYVGLRAIPVAQIVGTDSRGSDFDREFLPRRPDIGERWRRVEAAYPDGGFPPIVTYQLGDAYFVVDGHHRVGIARQRGMETIDAEVTELKARFHLRADADVVALIHAEQQRIFLEESGLAATGRPVEIEFSRPAGYLELLENVQIHGYHLMLGQGRVLTREEIASDWLDSIYLPTVEVNRQERLPEAYPDATDADFFLCVYQRRRELFPECGCPPLAHAAGVLVEEARRRRGVRGRLPGRTR